MAEKGTGHKEVAGNRKAFHDFFIQDRFEAGIELFGTEVKSIRMGRVNLKDAYVIIQGGQAYLHGCHISPYDKGNLFNKDPMRVRRLLLHKAEIRKMYEVSRIRGESLVPLRMYLKGGLVKVEIAQARGRKLHDKREVMAAKDAAREVERAFKAHR